MNRKEEQPCTPANLILAVCILALLCIFVAVLICVKLFERSQTVDTPEIVSDFISVYFSPDYETTDDLDIFSQCFEDPSGVENKFTEVCKMWSPGAESFEVRAVSNTFSIIRMYDRDGNQLTPPIGFWYTCSDKIDSWWVGRLQPFSRYDPEYSPLWEGLYGWS